jgi:pyridoxamine-phosphate oxidase
MIKFIDINKSDPYKKFINLYERALNNNQRSTEAVSISSFNKSSNEVESRFVNLKYIKNEEWIFFSNYNSQKAKNFKDHDQVSALFYWRSINIQIRIKAKIFKTSTYFSDEHFLSRSNEKNALAVSSKQSDIIKSYKEVISKYSYILDKYDQNMPRPDYWGGYSFIPYYFEFWEGHDSRLNKREAFKKKSGTWTSIFLEP